MVADKTQLDRAPENQHLYNGDNITVKHNTSHGSSSDESSKCKSENETQNSSKEEKFVDEHRLNRTYSCPNSEVVGDNKNEESPTHVESKDDEEIWRSDKRNCKHRNLFSISNNLDTSQWHSELGDLKIDNIELEFSRAAVDENTDECLLVKMRNYLAEYQESRGTPREEYTFSILIRIMGQATGRCLLALFYVIINVAPVFEIFLHILRFILDKTIDIKNTTDIQQIIVKSTIFLIQLLGIYVCLMFIFGFIVSPVVRMTFGILAKIMLYD